jgi:superfamily II DNA/RNA helicase
VQQISAVASKLLAGTPYRVVSLIGGVNVQNQIKQLRESKPQLLVATPGRLAELVFKLERVRLGMVRALVVDEVDHLLQEPFVDELQTLMQATPLFAGPRAVHTNEEDVEGEEEKAGDVEGEESEALRRTKRREMVCLASATGSDSSVTAFASRYLRPQWMRLAVQTGDGGQLPRTITHGLISSPRIKAMELLRKLLRSRPAVQCALVFVNDPHRVEVLCEQLLADGFLAAPLHGESSKDDRKEILARLRSGRLGLVVTTELAARGLDIPDLTHVINYELPTNAVHYVHRAGRCGRAGREGLVVNFATPSTKFVVRRFGKQLKLKVLDCEIRQGEIYLKNM